MLKPFTSRFVIALIGTILLFFPSRALSVPGDVLYVQVDTANMREGDSLKHPVIAWLIKGHPLMEIQRRGEWVEVVADWSNGQTGWIHSSIISQNVVAGMSKTYDSEPFTTFMNAFDTLMKKLDREVGSKPFTEAIHLGEGIVQITATDFWLHEQTNIQYLYALLREMGESDFPVAIHVVDKNGNRHLSVMR